MKRIVLTGGGTAGHVTPNMALIPELKKAGYDIHYIGSYEGIEKKLITDFDIPYYGIATGKFRRYLDIKNLTDPFRVIKGFGEARKYLKKINPDMEFMIITNDVKEASKILPGIPAYNFDLAKDYSIIKNAKYTKYINRTWNRTLHS